MNPRISFVTAIALALSSQIVTAGALTIPNTFADGDTLTAGELNTNNVAIEVAVDDNDRRIAINETASRFYGDGSAGPLPISATTNWTSTPPTGNNLNFTNVVIDAGTELTVPAGTTIRCSGTFTNNGTITVTSGADKPAVGFSTNVDSTANGRSMVRGHPGDSFAAPSAPEWHNNFTAEAVTMSGATGGIGIPRTTAASSFNSFRIGGGAGSGHSSSSEGGGLLKIYCNGAITNAGLISANGNVGAQASGGGAGGIVILASQTSVDSSAGTIQANGGNGGDGGFGWGGRGGGGGGGIIMSIAPTINNVGATLLVTGGLAGTGGTDPATTNVRISGGGGGACGGNGGAGGSIGTTGTLGDAVAGDPGYTLEILANPGHMM